MTVDATKLDRDLRLSKRKFGDWARASSGGFGRVSRGAIAMGTAMGAAFGAGARGAAEFDRAFSRFAARTGSDVGELRRLYARDAEAISQATGVATDTIIDGFQRAVSAGASGQRAIDLVRLAAKAEAAEVSRLGDAVDAATALHSAFGDVAGTLADKLDAVTAAAQVGKGDTAAFATALAQAAPLASNLGLTLEDTAGALADISAKAASVPQGATQFIAFLNAIVKPSAQAEKVLGTLGDAIGRVGYDGAAVRRRIASGGLVDVLREFQSLGTGARGRLLGGTEAINFVAGVDPDSLADLSARIADSLGSATQKAFDQGADDLTRRLAQIARVWETSMRRANSTAVDAIDIAIQDIGGWDALAGIFELLSRVLRSVVRWLVDATLFVVRFRHALFWVGGVTVSMLALGAAVHTVVRAWWALHHVGLVLKTLLTKEFWGGLAKIRNVFTASFWKNMVPGAILAAKIALFVAAVAALAYVASLVIRAWQPVKEVFSTTWDSIKAGAEVLVLTIRNGFYSMRDAIFRTLNSLAEKVNSLLETVDAALVAFGRKPLGWRLPTFDLEKLEKESTDRTNELTEATAAWEKAVKATTDARGDLAKTFADTLKSDLQAISDFSLTDLLDSGIPTATPPPPPEDWWEEYLANGRAVTAAREAVTPPPPPDIAPPDLDIAPPDLDIAPPDMQTPAETAAASLSDALREAFRRGDLSDVGELAWQRFRGSILDRFFDRFESALGNLFDGDGSTGFLSGLLNFDRGGTVPGPEGAPRLAVVHGGEVVTTPAQRRQGGVNVTQNISVQQNLDDAVLDSLRRHSWELGLIARGA